MSDEFKLQWSVSLPPVAQYAKGHMLNIRGESVEEVNAIFDQVLESGFIQKALDVAALVCAGHVVQEAAAAPQQDQSATVTQHPASQGLKTCAHGVREFRSGTNRQGKPYKGWFCPEKNRNAQCAVVWED